MNRKYLLTTIKIVAFGVVPFLVETSKKALDNALADAVNKVNKEK